MYVRSASPSLSPGYSRGVGQVSTAQTAEQIAGIGLTTVTSILVYLQILPPPAGQIAAAIVALAAVLVQVFKGCGQTCIEASNYANQVETVLQQNLATYLSSAVRTTSMQAAAITNYNTAIAALEAACGQAALGSAGTNCIDERVNANSCQWKASPGGWEGSCPGTYQPWGAAGSGSSCWNWVIGYLDPIQNDPCVQPDSVLTAGSSTSSSTSATSSVASSSDTIFGLPAPLVIGGLLLAAFLL